ncbi:MAG: hypothetical protein R3F48_16825 [Candidatus Zixiibacteriota bacterium]
MNATKIAKPLFNIAGLYDGILGLIFLIFGMHLFTWLDITPPNHVGYIQFPAALLIIFGLLFFGIAKDPKGRSYMILYGILLKCSYCAIVFSHWIISGLPWIWKPFAIIDAVFLVLFIWMKSSLEKS